MSKLIPFGWRSVPFWSLFVRGKQVGFPSEELLSVYRDYGVIRRSDRDDNWNRPGQDMSAYQLVTPGDLVLNKMKTWQGSLGVSEHRGIVSPAYFVYTSQTSDDPRFLHHALRSRYYIKTYASISKGVRPNQWDLQPEMLDAMHVLLPPEDTQRAIADYLDWETGEIDAMLDKMDELAETLNMRQLELLRQVTQFSPDGKRWKTAPTEHLFTGIGSGTTPKGDSHYTESGDGVPWVTTSELRESVIAETKKRVTHEAVSSVSSLNIHPKGSVMIAMYGATIGRLGILGVDATVNQACCVFSDPQGVDMRYFYYTLWGQRDDIIRLAVGGGQPNISQSMLRRWRIPFPPLEEQRRIADRLDEVTGKIDTMLAKTAELKQLLIERRAALITDVVTGRKQVTV